MYNKNKTDLVNEKFDNFNLDREFNHISINNDLLSLKGESSYVGINTAIKGMVIFVLAIIVLATIFLIYNQSSCLCIFEIILSFISLPSDSISLHPSLYLS